MKDKDKLLQSTDEINLSSDTENDEKPQIVDGDEEIDIDEFLRRGGECGRFQIMIVSLIIVAVLPMAFPVLSFYYIGHDPSWSCKVNIPDSVCNMNMSTSFPHDDTRRCSLNRSDWQYEYRGKTSIATEFDLVCSHAWLDALIGSIVFVGWGLGSIVMGILSDRYGRKGVMFPALFMALLMLLLHTFVKNIWLLLVVRFFMGFFYSAPALNSYVMVIEFVGPNHRVLATGILNLLWPLSATMLTIKAFYIDNWRTLALACSAPYFLGLLTAFVLPESVRWLNLKGRTKEAEAFLLRAAHINKKMMPPVSLKPAFSDEISTGKKASYIDLFKMWSRAKIVLTQAFLWFHCGMTYYGLSWAFADLGGDIYVNFILSTLIEIPGCLILIPVLAKFGRKKTTIATSVLTMLACFAVACTPKTEALKVLRVCFGLFGKFMISCTFNCIYIWSSEIYPTAIRTQGMSINIIASRAGAATSPFIKLLDQIHPSAPFILMSFTSLISSIFSLALPRTSGKPTRETLDDLTNNKKDSRPLQAVFSFNENNVEFNDDSSEVDADDQFDYDDREEETDILLMPHVNVNLEHLTSVYKDQIIVSQS